ncbi:uncharacterized protein [Amphiura filiformis]|uniref:uncharacterized protein isoform X2 n=1 Tax=Amphiura filiformis TaxID=82378 RepID=UPI003B20D00F
MVRNAAASLIMAHTFTKRAKTKHRMKTSETTKQQHHFCNKAFAVRYRIAIGLFVICTFGLIADNWFTETFGSNPLSYIGMADSDKVIHFHLSLFASGSERLDYNTTPHDNTDLEEDTCEVPRFDNNSAPSPIVTCKRPKPRTGSCHVAQQVFFLPQGQRVYIKKAIIFVR